jgi:uncharacterized protein
MEIWTGFIVGLVGSLHCIGMCGPIVLTLPGQGKSNWKFIVSRILYNFGRTVTYTIFGVLIGVLGIGVRLAGYQSRLSLALGIIILIGVLVPTRFFTKMFSGGIWKRVGEGFSQLWFSLSKKNTTSSMLLIGILNGFLPCGFVYFGLVGAASTSSVLTSALYMTLFGIGTIPVMLATAYAGNFIGIKLRLAVQRFIPIAAVVIALLLIFRGLALGIPYLSPKISAIDIQGKKTVEIECCH